MNGAHDWGVKIHVDGASGGFVAPFLYPDLEWDFRLSNVACINVSGHKYGLVYPGVGWVLWRDPEHLPSEMVFLENYLGTVERSITLNFSKGAAQIIAQYYQFLRLGFLGYRKIFMNLEVVKKRLRHAIAALDHFELLSPEVGVPVVAFRLTKLRGSDGKMHRRMYDEYDLMDRLRMRGWTVPAYTMPPKADTIKLMRVTIREDLSVQMADRVRGRGGVQRGVGGGFSCPGLLLCAKRRLPGAARGDAVPLLPPPSTCCSRPALDPPCAPSWWTTCSKPSSGWTRTTSSPPSRSVEASMRGCMARAARCCRRVHPGSSIGQAATHAIPPPPPQLGGPYAGPATAAQAGRGASGLQHFHAFQREHRAPLLDDANNPCRASAAPKPVASGTASHACTQFTPCMPL